MSKYVFPDGPADILNKYMSYEDFIDALTDAWLTAEKYEGPQPEMFRRALFYSLDKIVEAKV